MKREVKISDFFEEGWLDDRPCASGVIEMLDPGGWWQIVGFTYAIFQEIDGKREVEEFLVYLGETTTWHPLLTSQPPNLVPYMERAFKVSNYSDAAEALTAAKTYIRAHGLPPTDPPIGLSPRGDDILALLRAGE